MKRLAVCLLAAALARPALGQEPKPVPVPAGAPVTITVVPAPAPAPSVTLNLGRRTGRVTPQRECFCHTGGGNVDVQQPSPDTLVITVTGVAVAVGAPLQPGVAALDFDVDQAFEVSFEKPDVKAAKLSLEARVIGLLRSHKHGCGSAELTHACATVLADQSEVLSVALPDHVVSAGENLSINDHEGPVTATVAAGNYSLHQVVHLMASHPQSVLPCKAASAEFAPDPALDPLWISSFEPFHGAVKKDFGFQLTLKVSQDTAAEAPPEKIPSEPKKVNGKTTSRRP